MLFLYLLVGAAWFWPWYLSWLLALTPLGLHTGRQRAASAFSALALLSYFTADLRLPLAPYFSGVAVTALTFGGAGALFGAVLWQAWRGSGWATDHATRGQVGEATAPLAVAGSRVKSGS